MEYRFCIFSLQKTPSCPPQAVGGSLASPGCQGGARSRDRAAVLWRCLASFGNGRGSSMMEKGTPNNLDDVIYEYIYMIYIYIVYIYLWHYCDFFSRCSSDSFSSQFPLTFLSMGMWGCCCPIDGMILVPSHTCHANLSIGHFIFGVDNEGLANESGIHDINYKLYIWATALICVYGK